VTPDALRSLIRSKLEAGLLPYNHIPRVWGGPASGETCDACDSLISKDEFVIEGIAVAGDAQNALNTVDRRKPLQLHVPCFSLWDQERRR
jgi:hypothetical protein